MKNYIQIGANTGDDFFKEIIEKAPDNSNIYLIEANKNEKLLIECGISYHTILKGIGFNIKGIQGCLISHEHL